MMPIIETLATGISLLSIGNNLYDWVTGHTVSKRIEELSIKIEKIDRYIYSLNQQEVWDKSVSKQNLINNINQIIEAVRPIQKSIGSDLVVSSPIVIPKRFQTAFLKNPEELLFDISPLRGEGIPESYRDDPTMIPVTFNRWGQEFIGLIKSGYARDYLDIVYKPLTDLIFPTHTIPSRQDVIEPQQHDTELLNRILSIISSQLGVEESLITFESRFVEDLGCDSLDTVELVMAFEDKFSIEIPDEEAERLSTVGTVYQYLAEHSNLFP